MICYWYEAPTYLFFAPDLPPLLYYSHIPTAIIALLVGTGVLISNWKGLSNRLLFALSVCFSLWIFINLVAWTNIDSRFLLFTWSFYGILQALMSVISVALMYTFINKRAIPVSYKAIFLLLLTPAFIFSATDINVSGFNLAWCDAFDYEGFLYKGYYTSLGILAMLWIIYLMAASYKKIDVVIRRQMILMGTGLVFFLFSFFSILFTATYLASLAIVEDSRLEFFGLFGMTIFMVLTSIMIVRFKAFNVSLVAPQALTIALVILVGSQFTYLQTPTTLILSAITLVLVGVVGIILARSIKREIEQRKQIESLANNLSKANARLKELDKMKSEFVSIASHQLRSPLTSIRGYASMLLEGSYGVIPEKAKPALERIADSSKHMVSSVEDYLNVSRIESGNMKYEMSDFNFKTEVEHVVDELRPVATQRGLLLTFRSDISSQGIVNADIGKTRQALHNLINNSIKYTEKGSIIVTVGEHQDKKQIWAAISDTGVGMTSETQAALFAKFSRAKDANKTNVSGTGLGLFVARKMIQEMKGDIDATSDGIGKGSTFTLTLPLQQ